MNRIASEIVRIAADLLPRIKASFPRTPKTEERDLNSIHFDIQRFVSTLRRNEQLEALVSRRDDDKVMEVTIGFSDHEAMQGIVKSMKEMLQKLGKKSGMKPTIDVLDVEKVQK